MKYPRFVRSLISKTSISRPGERVHHSWPSLAGDSRWAVFAVVFAAIGSILLFAAHAATSSRAFTLSPQSGQVGGSASVVSDSTAINGKALRFGSGSGSAPTSCGPATKSTSPPSGSSYGTNALSQWNCALANRASQPATWVAWGDSVDEGQGSKTVTGRWINQVLGSLRSTYPTDGVTGGFGYLPSWYGTYGVSDPTSAWHIQPQTSGNATMDLGSDLLEDLLEMGNGPGLGLRTDTVKSGGSVKFSVSGTSADIMYNYGSGSFSYKVDSGSATTVNTSGGSGAAGVTHVKYPSAGSHTITVTDVSGSVIVEGVMEYNGDENKGIRLYEGGQSGLTTGELIKQLPAVAAITAKVKADLVIIDLGANDYELDAASPPQTATNLTAMVKAIRAASTDHEPSIVITLSFEDPNDSTWQKYMSAIRGVAAADPTIGLVDMTSFASTSGNSSLVTSDGHPSDPSGQARYASLMEAYLEDE